ncbi:MAG: electron transport complex subunit RsxA [Candidatus Eisenbacteria bacterium]|nr:electron transport complex subunit RsxA [Candidatus Eisenbacteria bacterium]
MEILILVITALLIKNILLLQYLGNCPFLGVSKRMDTAVGMGLAVVFVMTLATAITWLVQKYALDPLGIGYLQTLAFILVIASLVQFVEMFLRKAMPALYQALGIFLPLITTNCAVFGVAVLAIRNEYNFVESVIFAIASSAGFALALVLMAGIRERLEAADVPAPLRGTAIGLITAGLMALAFLGFLGVDNSLKALTQS